MLIAEYGQVLSLYPGVSSSAVEHLLWALHRVRPMVEAGDTHTALIALRADVVRYRGDADDLARLGVPGLFSALAHGRLAFANALGAAGLLAPGPGSLTRYVILGPLLDARMWARARGIGYQAVLAVTRPADTFRLRGLPAAGLAIVRLGERRGTPAVEDALTMLLQRGAITLSSQWRPGQPPQPAPAGPPDAPEGLA